MAVIKIEQNELSEVKTGISNFRLFKDGNILRTGNGQKKITGKINTKAEDVSDFKSFVTDEGFDFKKLKTTSKAYLKLKVSFDVLTGMKPTAIKEKNKQEEINQKITKGDKTMKSTKTTGAAKKTATAKEQVKALTKPKAEKKVEEPKAETKRQAADKPSVGGRKPQRESKSLEPSLEKRKLELAEVDSDIAAIDETMATLKTAYDGVYNAWCIFDEGTTKRDSNDKIYARLEESSNLTDQVYEELKAHRAALVEGRKAVVKLIEAHLPKGQSFNDETDKGGGAKKKKVEEPKAETKKQAEAKKPEAPAKPVEDAEVLKAKAKKANEFLTVFLPELKKGKQRILDTQKATTKRNAVIRLTKNRSIEVAGSGWITVHTPNSQTQLKQAFPVKRANEVIPYIQSNQ